MTQIRVVHQKNFTQTDNFITTDKRLSWKAKGIWLYAFTRPDDWVFYIQDLVKQSTDGIDSVSSGLSELEKAGYLVRKRNRDEKGRLTTHEWIFYEIPCKYFFDPELDFPRQDKPILDNPVLLKTKREQILKRQQQDEVVVVVSSQSNSSDAEKEHLHSDVEKEQSLDSKDDNDNDALSSKNSLSKDKKLAKKPTSPSDPLNISCNISQKNNFTEDIAPAGRTIGENPRESSSSKIHDCLIALDIPDKDKQEISKYSEHVVMHAVKYALSKKEIGSLTGYIIWGCKYPEKIIKLNPQVEALNRQVWSMLLNGMRNLNLEHDLRDCGEYVEAENDRIYYRDYSFLEQLENYCRKSSIEEEILYKFLSKSKEERLNKIDKESKVA